MKSLKISMAVALVTLMAAQTSFAAPPVYFKKPVEANGTGCPNLGSLTAVGEGTDTLSILFGGYDAGNNTSSSTGLGRAACNFAVPVHVPKGWQLSVMTADWMGYVKGNGRINRKYFFAGSPFNGVSKSDNLSSAGGTDFTKRDGLLASSYTSGCQPSGRDVNLRINSSIQAKTSGSYIAVDTLDLQNKVVFHLKWAPCP